MALFDMPLPELRAYRPQIDEPDDFDAFWAKTLAETRAHDPAVSFEPVETGLTGMRTWDVTFAGFGGHPIKGWFSAPADAEGPLPLVVQFHGYNGGRSLPHCWGMWPLVASPTSSWTYAARAAAATSATPPTRSAQAPPSRAS